MKKIFSILSFASFLFIQLTGLAQNWVNGGNTLTATGKFGTKNSQSVVFITNNTERGRITNGGNWGIGSTGTTSRFTVNSASGVSPFRAQVNGSTKFIVNGNGGVSIGSSSSGPSNGLYVSGNVGIGTSSPLYKLQVAGNASISSGLYVGNNGIFGYNSSGSGVYGSGSTYGVYGTGVDYGVYGYTTGNYGVFGNAGTVGVYGNGGSYGISGNASSSSGYGMFGQGGSIGVYGSGSSFGLYGYSGVQTAIYGYTGGGGAGNPTGVYGNNDSYGYGVAGYCRYGSGIFGSGGTYAGYFAGNVYSGGSYLGSDRKLKQNITNLESAMDVINKLRPKVYEFRQDGNFKLMNLPQGTHFGLIAQDLEQVLPNLVKDTKFDTRMALPGMKIESNPAQTKAAATQASEIIDFKAVNYTELIPIIIKGMQELNVSKDKKINDLQNQINKQQLEIDELKTLLQSITKPGVNITPTSAFIKQNTPNPLTNSTVISYYTPNDTRNAQILISDMKGSVLRTFNISKGEGQINMNVGELTAGTYNYTLYVNSNKIDTKQLIIVK